ncbi:saponin hydrolase precursor [Colletotrichum truncatum]|uniref:Saponin hydrolase n=1 Tax=Colletotrichum truncatum TaxID=5467 RepID=A0ACC3YVK2_COLTU|nr:saponin hydrolase precursor [Colletotrichum truncatum]KAF6791285.1 saponin hydrolase precursor [Colletotrichum truncatum]
MRFRPSLSSTVCAVATYAFAQQDQARLNGQFEPFTVGDSIPSDLQSEVPPPPEPEPVTITELPLPPVTTNTGVGGCTAEINPRRTGCIGQSTGLQSGDFLPDDKHVVATVTFTGAPAAPDAASIYTGPQLIIVKVDGTTFPNGDAWKCITCGVPVGNAVGRDEALDYPQIFNDGKRLLAGPNIIECSADLASEDCTPDKVHIYPIRWNTAADGSGPGGSIRELRIHPDNQHLGWSSFVIKSGKLGQYGYIGRLEFNPSPISGIPLAPRYDLVNVNLLFNPNAPQPIEVDPEDISQLRINRDAIVVGEIRGFSGTGKEVTFIGYPFESSNIDVFAADLTTGKVRRLTAHPDYTDPVDVSPDDKWTVAMDTRGSGRQMFMAGLRGIPPLTDIVSSSVTSSTRNNRKRRFFQPWLIDGFGDRGSYFGQQLNAEGDGVPGGGAVNDPEWNGRADPKWSNDGTRIVYWQALTTSPSCGGQNPLPCYQSTAPGGRTERMMLAHLTSRQPQAPRDIEPLSDIIPWATPYKPGDPAPDRSFLASGKFTLWGKFGGRADVTLTPNTAGSPETVAVEYHDFSDDGINVLVGFERVTARNPTPTLEKIDWFSDLVQTGPNNGTKKTSQGGFHLSIDIMKNVFEANGTLTTTVNGKEWHQPANGT